MFQTLHYFWSAFSETLQIFQCTLKARKRSAWKNWTFLFISFKSPVSLNPICWVLSYYTILPMQLVLDEPSDYRMNKIFNGYYKTKFEFLESKKKRLTIFNSEEQLSNKPVCLLVISVQPRLLPVVHIFSDTPATLAVGVVFLWEIVPVPH